MLVVDQTLGDASIRYGLADAGSFARMPDAALAENPDCTVLLKVHPDVLASFRQGHFDLDALANMGVSCVLAVLPYYSKQRIEGFVCGYAFPGPALAKAFVGKFY